MYSALPARLIYQFTYSLIILITLSATYTATAQTDDRALQVTAVQREVYLPPDLRPWREWVLYHHPTVRCAAYWLHHQTPPGITNDPAHHSEVSPSENYCTWPGPLILMINSRGARFEQSWTLDTEGGIPLPGDGHSWPQEVRVNGEPVPLHADESGRPSLSLPAGKHIVNGYIPWQQQPEYLSLPNRIALVELYLDGTRVHHTKRDKNGSLWLNQSANNEREENALTLLVGREIHDDIPLRVITKLELNIYGEAREIRIGPALLDGFEPIRLISDLNAHLEPDGTLYLQLQPGNAYLELEARATTPIDQLTVPQSAPPWPDQEFWTVIPDPPLRAIRVDAGRSIDPTQTPLPALLNTQQPVYQMQAQEPLSLVELYRGLGDISNRLNIERRAWLSFDGRTLTQHDQFSGVIRTGWRLDAQPPFAVRYAHHPNCATCTDFSSGIQLITQSPDAVDSAVTGFEWRIPQIAVQTLSTSPFQARLPLTAWNQNLNHLKLDLNLPPAYRLLGASGFDHANGSWWAAWNMLNIFLLILTAVLIYHLAGWPTAAFAALFLILARQEIANPDISLLITSALLLILHWARRIERGVRWFKLIAGFALLILAIQYLGFAFIQLQSALYPQLEPNNTTTAHHRNLTEAAKMSAPTEQDTLEYLTVSGSRIAAPDEPEALAPDARLQAGVGLPDWRWHHYRLERSGPISSTEYQQLWISPPWLTRLWRLLATLCGLWVLLQLARRWHRPPADAPKSPLPAALLLALGLLSGTAQAQGAFPSSELLNELSSRLREAPQCAPNCVSATQLNLRIDGNTLNYQLELHSNAYSVAAIPWPDDDDDWSVLEVRLNDRPAALQRNAAQVLVAVPPGIHHLRVQTDIEGSASLSLSFPLAPHWVETDTPGWRLEGVQDHLLLAGNITLQHDRPPSALTAATLSRPITPYVHVERWISLDLKPQIYTLVSRIAPISGTVHVPIPLLAGEQFLDGDAQIENGIAQVSVGESPISWRSDFPLQSHYQLTAPDLSERVETWRVTVSPIFHPRFNGPAPSQHPENIQSTDNWRFYYQPRPGETLHIDLSRPPAVDDATTVFDSVRRYISTGRTFQDYRLEAALRVAHAGPYQLTLPEEAVLQSVQLNDREIPVQLIDGKLDIDTRTGSNTLSVHWQEPLNDRWHIRSSALDLQRPAANITTHIEPLSDRWILWVYGPSLGPALQFWSLLALLVLVAWLLSHLPHTPLRFWHWLILGLGFSTANSTAFFIVIGFVAAMAWRQHHALPQQPRALGMLIQLVLATFALITALIIISSVVDGLLARPDMHLANHFDQSSRLLWFTDRSTGPLPVSGIISAPLWLYRAAMLGWALWLSINLVRWLRWSWEAFNHGGLWPARPATNNTTP